MKYKNYIFDLDGTLFDTQKDVIECFQYAFNTVLKINIELDHSIIGPPLIQTVKKIKSDVNEEELEKIMTEFKNRYDNSNYPNTFFYRNVLDVLKTLKTANKSLFIATNKRLIPTIRILKQFKVKDYFTELYTSDSFGVNLITKNEMVKQIINNKLARNETCIIGDTSGDIQAGIDNQIDTYFVSYGYEAIEKINYHPNYIIDDIIEILK